MYMYIYIYIYIYIRTHTYSTQIHTQNRHIRRSKALALIW